MSHGITATLSELIYLERCVQRKRSHPRARAARYGTRETQLRGRGMDFADVRNYQAGDEIRHMEWRATARTGRAHIKLYQEERERPVILLVDFNPSMYFGTRDVFKSVLAARLAALLAWTSSAEGDRVGGFLFSGEKHIELPPKSKRQGVLPLLSALVHYTDILHETAKTPAMPLNDVLIRLKRVLKPGSLLVMISDFYSMDEQTAVLLRRLKLHNDLLAYHVCDPLEVAPPPPGIYPITNGQARQLLDVHHKAERDAYQALIRTHNEGIEESFLRLNTPLTRITSLDDWVARVQESFPRSRHG